MVAPARGGVIAPAAEGSLILTDGVVSGTREPELLA